MADPVGVRTRTDQEILHVLGVGSGSADPGVAIAPPVHDRSVTGAGRVTGGVVERRDPVGWHRGTPLGDATGQVSRPTDLITLRDTGSGRPRPAGRAAR
ncbi:SidA/IucD/PvdA family monooxygenase [Pseudonocardia sp. ICBG601]|uniref:SidA/IucD/PvdA family monooxygenase n=1 Tax=Pseudonocardia sp. ICBG601 TaxID=2846759 RepID=UPI001CF66706